MRQPPPLVFAFDNVHKVGTVCGVPCHQCGESEETIGELSGINGAVLPPTPMLIVREASVEEWRESVLYGGGQAIPSAHLDKRHFYVIAVD